MNEETIIALTAGSILVTKLYNIKELLEGLSIDKHDQSSGLTNVRDALTDCLDDLKDILPSVRQLNAFAMENVTTRDELLQAWDEYVTNHPAAEDSTFNDLLHTSLDELFGESVSQMKKVTKLAHKTAKSADALGDKIESVTDSIEEDSDTLMEMYTQVSSVIDHMPLPPMAHEDFDTALKRIFGVGLVDETMFMHRIQRSA